MTANPGSHDPLTVIVEWDYSRVTSLYFWEPRPRASAASMVWVPWRALMRSIRWDFPRSEEHTSEIQSLRRIWGVGGGIIK